MDSQIAVPDRSEEVDQLPSVNSTQEGSQNGQQKGKTEQQQEGCQTAQQEGDQTAQQDGQNAQQEGIQTGHHEGCQTAHDCAAGADSDRALHEIGDSRDTSGWSEPSGEGTYEEIGALCSGQPPPWSFQQPWPPTIGPPSFGPPGMGHPGMDPPGMGHPGMGPPGIYPPVMGPCMPPPGMIGPGFVRFRPCPPPPMMYRLCYPRLPTPTAPRRSRKRRRESSEPSVEGGETTTTTTGGDGSTRTYTPRASKVTSQSPPLGASDMLVEALRRGPDAAMRIARTLFSKRMLTLYGWLYPNGSRRDLKHNIERLWERLPDAEKRFYLAQAEGVFGSRGGRPMVNPQLAALAGLPVELETETKEESVDEHRVSLCETEQAVNDLLLADQAGIETTSSDLWEGGDAEDDGNLLGLPRLLEYARQEELDHEYSALRGGVHNLDDILSGNEHGEFPEKEFAFQEGGFPGEEYQERGYTFSPTEGEDGTLFDGDFAVASEVVLSAEGDEIQ